MTENQNNTFCNPEQEIWKDIPDCPSYQASTFGRIRSSLRKWKNHPNPRILQQHKKHKGEYLRVKIKAPAYRSWTSVARLVLLTFVGPCPEGMNCCHNDGNKFNNHLSNLRWGTPRSNYDDVKRHGSHKGENGSNHKLTDENVRQIRLLLTHGKKQGEIAKLFSVSYSTIGWIKKGVTWTHVT